MIKIELKEWQVRKLREYFGYNSKTQTSHWAFKVFDKAFEDHRNKEHLEYGRWVVDDKHPNCMTMFDKENKLFYGLNSNKDWFCHELDDCNPNSNGKSRYATDEEILSKLSNAALEMGFKDGVSVCFESKSTFLLGNGNFVFEEGKLYKGLFCIMKYGDWAKIIKTDKERIALLEQRVEELQEKLKNKHNNKRNKRR